MLLTAPPTTYTPTYVPLHPSPLSERSANAAAQRPFCYASPIMSIPPNSHEGAQKQLPFSKRAVKKAPVVADRETMRERRRDLFMKRVAHNREEKRWEQRGDQILRLDCIKEQKRWEAEKARSAPTFDQWVEEEEERDAMMMSSQATQSSMWQNASRSYMPSSQTLPDPDEEARYIEEMERQELEELAAIAEEDERNKQAPATHYGSDHDDYDSLFMEYLSGQENQQPQFDAQAAGGSYSQMMDDDIAMDMSQ